MASIIINIIIIITILLNTDIILPLLLLLILLLLTCHSLRQPLVYFRPSLCKAVVIPSHVCSGGL